MVVQALGEVVVALGLAAALLAVLGGLCQAFGRRAGPLSSPR
jgi:hypothetical protein